MKGTKKIETKTQINQLIEAKYHLFRGAWRRISQEMRQVKTFILVLVLGTVMAAAHFRVASTIDNNAPVHFRDGKVVMKLPESGS